MRRLRCGQAEFASVRLHKAYTNQHSFGWWRTSTENIQFLAAKFTSTSVRQPDLPAFYLSGREIIASAARKVASRKRGTLPRIGSSHSERGQPASLTDAATRRYPYRPYRRVSSIILAIRRSSPVRPFGNRRCVDRCRPRTRQTRRSETFILQRR